ncbi:CST complex subunit TEN1 [Clinocottus analis]|uniref:CST complex subunit TEN1 n=1 Tax=Clinocottus analis TaxID=304258 RepID=UPI0035C09030
MPALTSATTPRTTGRSRHLKLTNFSPSSGLFRPPVQKVYLSTDVMLPAAAAFYFPWEVNSVQEGESVRVFGRLVCYQPEESRATLSAQHASKEHNVAVHTMFVEPFNPIIGAQYIVLGEIENTEGVGAMVRARVLNCVDGVNLALLQKAINEQRSFFGEREPPCDDAQAT